MQLHFTATANVSLIFAPSCSLPFQHLPGAEWCSTPFLKFQVGGRMECHDINGFACTQPPSISPCQAETWCQRHLMRCKACGLTPASWRFAHAGSPSLALPWRCQLRSSAVAVWVHTIFPLLSVSINRSIPVPGNPPMRNHPCNCRVAARCTPNLRLAASYSHHSRQHYGI